MKNDNNTNSCRENKSIRAELEDFFKNWKKLLKDGHILSILFTGVGGQGIMLTTTIVAEAALFDGLDVKVSEVHGMAQRGGSVIGNVRIGEKVHSPVTGYADIIVSLEKLEALRYINRLDAGGFIIINDFEIYPVSMYLGGMEYPEDIISRVAGHTSNYMFIRATEIAKNLNEIRVSNTVLLGSLSNFIPIKEDSWIKSIRENAPRNAVEINLKAFKEGRKIINGKKTINL